MGLGLIDKVRLLYLMNKLFEEVGSMKNWKTTLFGAITAAGMGMAAAGDSVVKTIGQILSVIGPLLMGIFAKDSNVTGGTTPQ